MTKTHIEDPSNLSYDLIQEIMTDSINNKYHYTKLSQIFTLDHISCFFHFKIYHNQCFQFQTNIDTAELAKLLKRSQLFNQQVFSLNCAYFFKVIAWQTTAKSSAEDSNNNLTNDDQKALVFERIYTNRKESFYFIIDKVHFESLNFQSKSLLAERLNSIICLIQSTAKLTYNLHFDIPSNWDTSLDNRHHCSKLKAINHFDLSDITISYIKELAAGSHIRHCIAKIQLGKGA